jgi:DNA primase
MDSKLIDQIRQANDIVDVVQSYLPLKHVGANWRGICPFHRDTNPSLYVSQPKQIFKCFACGKAGNVFTFVQEYEHSSFIEAVKKLAQRASIAIPEFDRTKTVSTKRQQLLEIYRSARDFFSENLFKYGREMLGYLEGRKLSAETARNLELGYSLGSEKALLNHLMKEGYAVALLKESGLFGNYSGNLVDFFRDRLMFPIHNNIGEVIAFGGRTINPEVPNKYVNTSGTELYTKGKELYGLFKTKYEISKAGFALVCEGYFDFLRLYEGGFQNSVASLGTALTEDQVFLISRYAQKVYMLYDGDEAGIRNAERGALICLGRGLDAFIVELPDKHDPDSYLLEHGPDALRERIDGARSIVEYLADKRRKRSEAQRIDLLLDSVRAIRDQVKRELVVKEIAAAFGVSSGALFSKLRQTSRPAAPEPKQTAPQPAAERLEEYPEERQLLILALKDKNSLNLVASELSTDYFSNRINRELFKYLVSGDAEHALEEPGALLDNIENKEVREALAEILFEDLQDLNLPDLVEQVRLRKIQRDLEDLDRRISANPDDLQLLKQKEELSRNYRRLTPKVVHKILY